MKVENRALLFLLSAGMELCYLYAIVNLVTTLAFRQAWPFPETLGSFLAAALLTLFSEGRGWRVVQVLGLQSLGFIPALWRMVTVLNSWSDSFLRQTLVTEFFSSASGAVEYFVLALAIVWGLVFWAGGVGLARRPLDYESLCARFDRGLVAFFILFLAVFYFRAALGIKVDDPTPGLLIFPFLIFSLLAIGLVRSRGTVQRDFLPGYQIIGVMLGFIVVVLLAGIGVVIFFLPYLTLAAEQGNNLMNILARPFIAILTQVSHWLFGTELDIPAELPVRKTPGPNPSTAWTLPTWLEPLVTILSWIVLALLGIVVLAFVGVMVYIVFRWLFSKTSLNPEQPSSPRETLAAALAQLKALLLSLKRGLARHLQGRRAASHFYAGLASWGRNSGLPRLLYETPLEYSLRLGGRFPVLAGEIELIVESYNREVYGEMVLNEGQLASARSAWRELNRPSYWPMRLKAVFPGRSGETVGAR